MFLLSLQLPPPPTATRVSGFLGKNKKRGFTLAETLITLGIIGIIAAMTVPNLVNNYRKSQAETGLKEAYSILSNAITMAAAENGSVAEMIENCASTDDKQQLSCFANNYLKPYLKYSKSCEKEEKSSSLSNATDWTKRYCAAEFYPVTNYKDLDGTKQNMGRLQPHYQQVLALNNGMFVGLTWDKANAPSIIVDVNGATGPNQSGVDYFFFSLYEYDQTDNIKYSKIATGLRCENHAYFSDEAQNKANWCKESDRLGIGCACLVQSNGWRFPKDYPIKKW